MRLSDTERDRITKELGIACAKLLEMGCDSVQIVATAPMEGNNWCRFAWGNGNLYARYGAVRDWIDTQDGMILANEIALAQDGGEQ